MSQSEESGIPSVAEVVRDFYDRYPYPRPVDNLDTYRRLGQDRNRRRADFHLYWPARAYREDFRILIAGCGTSQATKHALRWPTTHVTGIDFCATSVRHTQELKRKYNLDNLQVYQLPIERVNDLEMRFDQIICTGVLHHLADPDAGLKALHGVLAQDGTMHLMVYAPYGRTGIYMLQEFCRRIGIQATESGIRDLVALLKALPLGHPLENLLREAPDFRQEAELADALLNPHERAYSILQFFELIQRAGFRFGRWVKQAPYLPNCGVFAHLRVYAQIARLPQPEQYAAVELFRGTLVRHSAILYRDDFPGDPQPVSFHDDAWLDYVPIRLTDTICVQDQLPFGAAGVLINQTHAYRDLYLSISTMEKRWFEAIDGTSKICNIIEKTAETIKKAGSVQKSTPLKMVSAFFERLWWYDQVVFDASCPSNSSEKGETQ